MSLDTFAKYSTYYNQYEAIANFIKELSQIISISNREVTGMLIQEQSSTQALYDTDYIAEIFLECYQKGRAIASDRSQLGVNTFPEIPIANLEQVLNEDWFPES